MAYSIIKYDGDGSTIQYAINFTLGFLSRSDVTCRVDNEVDGLDDPVYRTLTWINDGLVEIQGSPPLDGEDNVIFTRTVSKTTLVHDYNNGAAIDESNLDESNKQTLMAVQEFLDGRLNFPIQNDLDMGGNRITNMADGIDPQDAATIGQVSIITENIDDITTVADNIADVLIVAANIADINTVADNIADVNTVADNIANVNTVAGIDTEVTTVAGIDTEVTTVAGIDTEIETLAAIAANISTVAAIAADVTAVAGNATNINAVAANATNINAVNANSANINAAVANATNINAVVANATNINAVNANSTNINTVAGNSTNINTVAAANTAINTVATNITDVNNASNNANIAKSAGGFVYTYSTTTTASDPGSGFLRFNNATLASATAMYISETTALAQAIAAELATWDDSTSTVHTKLRIFDQSDPTKYALFNVTGTMTDNGTWDTFPVAYVSGNGTISNAATVTLQPLRTGDKGDTGAAGSVADGDKGDITVSSSGTVWTIDAGAVALTKIATQAANSIVAEGTGSIASPTAITIAANKFLARASTGNLAAKDLTDFALTLLDDTDAATMRATLGISSGVTSIATSGGITGGTITTTGTVSIDTNNSLGVGAYCFCKYLSGTSCTNGSTTAASNLDAVTINSSGVHAAASATLSGTWRNVSGTSQQSGSASVYGMFMRTA